MKFPSGAAEHERNVRAQPCIVSGGPSTLHHAQGPSINARLRELGLPTKGIGERGNGPALLLPLRADLHFFGPEGIDVGGMSRGEWETKYGSQAEMIDRLGVILGYDLLELHKRWLSPSKIMARRWLPAEK